MIEISFDRGSLVSSSSKDDLALVIDYFVWDSRTKNYRAEAWQYRDIALRLHKNKIKFIDNAKRFEAQDFELKAPLVPYPYQKLALDAWLGGGSKGLVILPTGGGKTILGVQCIARTKRNTLIVVPTIDLMHQWSNTLEKFFKKEIGLLGGGEKEIREITVSTYDSALIFMETIGNQFGFLIFDECHHLAGESSQYAALMSLAPYRLGLTATPERDDGRDELLYQLIGPISYRIEITDLEGKYLSDYEVESLEIALEEDEQLTYDQERQIYLSFVKENKIDFSDKNAWGLFLSLVYRSKNGKRAFEAYKTQKMISRASKAKMKVIWEILSQHSQERTLIFTDDNKTAYAIGHQFFLPVITHQTRMKERKEFLDKFKENTYPVLVTSRVLNEGIDVPEVSVAIIVSGTGSIREHVQRLGRILRKREGKMAILYELISEGTAETYTSKRRRDHLAYKRFNQV